MENDIPAEMLKELGKSDTDELTRLPINLQYGGGWSRILGR